MFKRKDSGSEPRQGGIFGGAFWKIFSMIGDFFILTLFWILTSLPIVTIGASTAALFYVFFKQMDGQAMTLWAAYKKSFFQNWKQATGVWLLYLFILIDLGIIATILAGQGMFVLTDFAPGGQYFIPFAIGLLLYLSMMMYASALLSTFQQTMGQCIASAFALTFNRIFSTLYYMIVMGLLIFLTLYIFPALVLIDVPLAVYLISLRMRHIFLKQIERTETRMRDKQDNDELMMN